MKNWLKGGLIGSIIGTLIYIFLILVHLNSRANKRYFFKPLIILSILFYGIIFAIIWAKKEDKEKSSYFSKGFLTGIIFGILSFTISGIKHIYWGLQVGSSPIWGNIQEILNPLYIFGDLIGLIFDMPGFGIHSLISITLTIIGYGLIGVIIYYIIQKIESKLQEQPQQEATI